MKTILLTITLLLSETAAFAHMESQPIGSSYELKRGLNEQRYQQAVESALNNIDNSLRPNNSFSNPYGYYQ